MSQSRLINVTFNLLRKKKMYSVFGFSRIFFPQVQVRTIKSLHSVSEPEANYNDFDMHKHLDFDNYVLAYRTMSNFELARALVILRLCSYNFIVDHSLKMMTVGRKLFGRKLFNKLLKATVYGHFVGGDSPEELRLTASRLQTRGLGPLLAVCIEEDVTDDIQRKEKRYDMNLDTTFECLNTVASLEDKHPMMQIKITALLSSHLCVSLSNLFPEPSTTSHIVERIAALIKSGAQPDITGLSDYENLQLFNGLRRLKKLCDAAVEKDIILMVDTEYTYLNAALTLFSLAMMLVCNTEKTLVYHTYQNYLKITHSVLLRDIEFVRGYDVGFGAKLVRGAYIDKERHLARTQGYPDPTNSTFDDTTRMYNKSMETMLQNVARNPSKYSTIIATHNEQTVKQAVNRVTSLGIDTSNGSIFFGQVYGMCDHVSYTLSNAGLPIYKSLPYGSVEDSLAYLSRRAMENRSVLDRADRERGLMRQALKARMFNSKRLKVN